MPRGSIDGLIIFILFLIFSKTFSKLFSFMAALFLFYPQYIWALFPSFSSNSLLCFLFVFPSWPMRFYFSIYLWAICMSSFDKCLLNLIAYFNEVSWWGCCWVYTLDIDFLSVTQLANICSHFLSCLHYSECFLVSTEDF